ncbi:hypothetical protein [Heliorestis convoluta]|uniref:Putative membrane protein n=1 Tax=Heliorestis convoluta TaxID=356322 RepID=A0A5Q2N0Q3_9FIRM|nr:hypothetical protein [Heliorestis convoluta]QGG48447.1 putative membrane protein [Heliorestis convoluta]
MAWGTRYIHTFIKGAPIGFSSLAFYSFTVTYAYPLYGIYWGTLMGYVVATVYLLLYE